MLRLYTLIAALGLLIGASASAATITLNFYQDGTDVVAHAFGSVDETGRTQVGTSNDTYDLVSSNGTGNFLYYSRPASSSATWYYEYVSPLMFWGVPGSGNTMTFSTSQTGSQFGLRIDSTRLQFFLDSDYVSGRAIDSTAIFANKTLAQMNLATGTYTQDTLSPNSVSVVIGSYVDPSATLPSVPLPASLPLLAAALGVFGGLRRRRKA